MGASVRIFAVLPETTLGTFREALRRCSHQAAELDLSGTVLEAIQKMYLTRPPDLFVTHRQIAGPSLESTIRDLRYQPGFEAMAVALEDSGCGPSAAPGDGTTPLQILPSPATVPQWVEYLSAAFPKDFSPAGRAIAAPAQPPAIPSREESRKALRRDLSAPCVIWSGARKHQGKLKDISLSGARVFVDAEFPISAHATLSVAVPGTLPMKVIQFKALVVRWEPGGYGLQFKEMDQETRHFLKHYIEGKVLDTT
jgi:hypothetical protein